MWVFLVPTWYRSVCACSFESKGTLEMWVCVSRYKPVDNSMPHEKRELCLRRLFLMKGNGSTITAIMFCTHRHVGPVWWWSVMSWQYFAITCPFHPIPKWWPALLLINGCWGATPGQMGRFVLKHALKGATPPGLLGIFGSPRHSTEFLKILKFFFLKWQNSAAICWELSRDLCRTATTVHLPYFHIGFDVIPSCI